MKDRIDQEFEQSGRSLAGRERVDEVSLCVRCGRQIVNRRRTADGQVLSEFVNRRHVLELHLPLRLKYARVIERYCSIVPSRYHDATQAYRMFQLTK